MKLKNFVIIMTMALWGAPLACAQASPPARTEQSDVQTYRMKGDKALFPEMISDDGAKTYIYWASDRELPAVFAINEQGQEILVDGYMRGEHYTIDRIFGRYVFRLDKDVAHAIRQTKGSTRQ